MVQSARAMTDLVARILPVFNFKHSPHAKERSKSRKYDRATGGFTPSLSAMDVPRTGVAAKKRKRRIMMIAGGALALIVITFAISRLKPAVPSVDRSTVWVDTVKRGPMVRQVRGLGTLVPEEIRWLSAETEGRVEKIIVRPGAPSRTGHGDSRTEQSGT